MTNAICFFLCVVFRLQVTSRRSLLSADCRNWHSNRCCDLAKRCARPAVGCQVSASRALLACCLSHAFGFEFVLTFGFCFVCSTNNAMVSRTPPDEKNGNEVLATYRCQDSTSRLEIKVKLVTDLGFHMLGTLGFTTVCFFCVLTDSDGRGSAWSIECLHHPETGSQDMPKGRVPDQATELA